MKSVIEIKNISFAYTARQNILTDVSLDVTEGTFLSIIGPNGVGKSTLLNLISGCLKTDSGIITLEGKNIQSYKNSELARKIAVVRQEFIPVFDFSVIEVVDMARIPHYGPLGFAGDTDSGIVEDALEATEMTKFAHRPIASLSGGERQRVFIARALAQQTDIILLDEPTNYLDPKHQVGIYDLLKTMQFRNNKTIITVTHDINLAAQYSENILMLGSDGSHIWGPTDHILNQNRIESIFGVKFHSTESSGRKFFLPQGKCFRNIKAPKNTPD